LTALIESDWMSMSFTMNWKLMEPNQPVRFERGEPLFQAIPLISNVCADLESADVHYLRLSEDPEMAQAYLAWNEGRRGFHELKSRGEVKPDDWQKDYFQGRDATGRASTTAHMTKIKPPRIQRGPGQAIEQVPPVAADGISAQRMRKANTETSRIAVPTEDREASMSEPSSVESLNLRVQEEHAARSENPVLLVDAQNVAACPVVEQRNGRPNETGRLQVDDEWRRWIAENLFLDATHESLVAAMTAAGISPAEADREVRTASESPYVRASELLRNRLKKRDWMLATYRKLNRLHPMSGEVDRRHKLRREAFLCEYYSTNRPVIITGMMDDWPALNKWTLDYFADRFGDRDIEVQMGRNAGANYEIEREKYLSRIKLSEFISMIRSATGTNDFYLTANNNSTNKQALPELWDDIVQIPEYLDGHDRMGGFFWLGPPGTITPFHHDLTNNFMAQVMGRKRVKIVPSWDMPLMSNDFHCYSRVDGRTRPAAPQPGLEEPQVLECILGPGEILFLPIGCLHFVEGIDASATVSFTNFVFDNDFSSFYTTYHRV
jgi:hypothetical protein